MAVRIVVGVDDVGELRLGGQQVGDAGIATRCRASAATPRRTRSGRPAGRAGRHRRPRAPPARRSRQPRRLPAKRRSRASRRRRSAFRRRGRCRLRRADCATPARRWARLLERRSGRHFRRANGLRMTGCPRFIFNRRVAGSQRARLLSVLGRGRLRRGATTGWPASRRDWFVPAALAGGARRRRCGSSTGGIGLGRTAARLRATASSSASTRAFDLRPIGACRRARAHGAAGEQFLQQRDDRHDQQRADEGRADDRQRSSGNRAPTARWRARRCGRRRADSCRRGATTPRGSGSR